MIEKQTADVFYAPTRRRRYLTIKAAVNAEAIAIIRKHYPPEPFESDTGHSFYIKSDRPEYYLRKYEALVRALNNKFKGVR